jgi:heterodisulfide reductase subunit B
MSEQPSRSRLPINTDRLAQVPGYNEKIFYFLGCTEKAYPGINDAFLDVCKLLGTYAVTSAKQSCCTGNFLSFNTAPLDAVVAYTYRNYHVMAEQAPCCITSCNGCFSSFHACTAYFKRDEALQARVRDVLARSGRNADVQLNVFHAAEFLYKNRKQLASVLQHSLNGLDLVVHYGCHFLHQEDPGVVLAEPDNPWFLEEMLEEFGAKVHDYKERLLCCGAGLNQRILHDDRANALKLTRRKLASIKTRSPDAIIVVCPYCELHLDSAQVELEIEDDTNYDIPVLHLDELLGIMADLPKDRLQLDVHKVDVDHLLEKIGYKGV